MAKTGLPGWFPNEHVAAYPQLSISSSSKIRGQPLYHLFLSIQSSLDLRRSSKYVNRAIAVVAPK